MNITFALKSFFGTSKKPSHVFKHFLLDDAKLTATLTFSDSTKRILPAVTKGPNELFPLTINISDVPDAAGAGGVTHKLLITSLTIEFVVTIFFDGKLFQLLKIQQQFSLTPTASNSDVNIDYTLQPFAWMHSSAGALRTSNAKVHPLLDMAKIASNRIEINTLIVDITDLWDHLHRKNRNYKIYKDLTDTTKVTFKVFAHLGGMSFIWFSIVPSYIKTSKSLSPHVFMSPSDLRDEQNIENEKKYLLVDNLQVFAGSGGKEPDGDILLLTYLLPPVDDTQITALSPKNLTKPDLEAHVKAHLRNVVHFGKTKKKVLEPFHWDIPAGFERAFYGLGKKNPQQILLMPQPFGNEKYLRMENTKGLKTITDTIIDFISTNTDLIQLPPSELAGKDKIILSAYSESGIDLWISSEVNIDEIKAIIGIEPNKVNPRGSKGPNGQATIPKLLNKNIKVFLIGNTFTSNHWYRPEIDASQLAKIRFLPDNAKILEYPPNPDSNDFVKYRVGRILDPTIDPFLLTSEQTIVTEFANKKPPVTGKKFLRAVFQDINNSYNWNADHSTFYNHHFALTGGRIMTLSDPVNFYNKPVTYQTFFQEAVEEIG